MSSTVSSSSAPVPAPSFIESHQVGLFYGYLYKSLLEWNDIYRKNTEHWQDAGLRELAKREWKTFADYWTYSLYKTFGIKRRYRRYGDDLVFKEGEDPEWVKYMTAFYGKTRGVLVQLFYDRETVNPDQWNAIQSLCRHLVFDMNSFCIVSLGLTRAVPVGDFEALTGMGYEEQMPVVLEEFMEGTMVIYNPRLGQFKMSIVNDAVDDAAAGEDDATQQKGDAGASVGWGDGPSRNNGWGEGVTRNNGWDVSTRKVLGTSYFNNPGMSFHQMFNANMADAGIDMTTAFTEEWRNNHILIFNTEHMENRMINPETRNCNTLIMAYRMKNGGLLSGEHATSILAVLFKRDMEAFDVAFGHLSRNQVELADTTAPEFAVFTKPRTLCQFYGPRLMDSPVINALFAGMTEYCPGVMVKAAGGIRTRIRNPRYVALLEIKGNTPISVSNQNKRHLFRLYWSLKDSAEKRAKFLEVFETPDKIYTSIFDWYKNCVFNLATKLYNEYMAVFVNKERHASTIPFEFKPLVGELHKSYKSSRSPTTKDRVAHFINGLDWIQVYWRLFGKE